MTTIIKTLSRSSSMSPLQLPPGPQRRSSFKEASKTEHTILKRHKSKTAMKDSLDISCTHCASNRGREALKEGYDSVHNCSCSQAIDDTVKKTNKRKSSETAQEKKLREEHRHTKDTEENPCLIHPVSTLNHNSYEDFKRRAQLEWITIDSHHRNITEHDTFC